MPLLTWFDDLKKNRYIDQTDLEFFTIVNSVEQILTILEAK
jgi:hypothetical protein